MTSIDDFPRVFYFRTGASVVSKDGSVPVMGERGILVVGSVALFAIERAKIGDANAVRLPNGLYQCKMETTTAVGKGFRVKAGGEYGHSKMNKSGNPSNLKIHKANYPHEITGCIAPGKVLLNDGVGQSKDAMEEIFNFCGGYADGKLMMIEVDSL